MPAAQRVAVWARQIRSRLLMMGVSLVVCIWVAVWALRTSSLTPGQIGWVFAAGLGYSLIWLVFAIIRWGTAKSALHAVAPTVAARIDRQGIWLQGAFLAWGTISQIIAQSRRFSMAPFLRIVVSGGQRYQLNLGDLDVMPGTIDASIRAFSQGRQWIDTSKLGN